ncbi:hypothetical protein TWF718_004068 [Orbilia javanica]|uniref:Bactericidal permeability-increasing protein n=1 Tax=Orbilia javanica TaxID=47235 RepID=A0AAN8NZ55_9PEZI
MSTDLSPPRSGEREPLLSQHQSRSSLDVVTGHQRNLEKKLRTYLLLRALASGYLPSTEQSVVLLRKFLASGFLAPDNQNLTHDGRKIITLNRRLVNQLIELIRTKNSGDEVQNFVWAARKARLYIDLQGVTEAATEFRVANYKAAYTSFSTISSLIFQNPDFNKLFTDVVTVLRQALSSGVTTAAQTIEQVADEIEPPDTLLDIVGGAPSADQPRIDKESKKTAQEIGEVLEEGIKKAVKDTRETLEEEITPERRDAMKKRVQQAVLNLKRNADYDSSVSTLTLLLKNYLNTYSTAVEAAIDEASDEVRLNKAFVQAGDLFWKFISSFGERSQWEILKERFKVLLEHKNRDPNFENIIDIISDSLRRLLTDPDYLFVDEDELKAKYDELKGRLNSSGGKKLREDVDGVIEQLQRVIISVHNDKQIKSVGSTALSIADLALTNSGGYELNSNLISDIGNVLVPLALETIQYIPIPRLTLVSPDIDILLEPIIFEPGKTINRSSFMPYRVAVVTTNEVDTFKGLKRTETHKSSDARIKIEGLTFKTEDVGYIMKVHRNWLVNFTDQGIASIRLDEKGIDIYLDLEFTTSSVDELVILKGISVQLHKVDFSLKRSKFSFLAWIFKPIIKSMLRKLLQNSLRQAIENGLRTLNREMVYTRERLRATRIANPHDLTTFIRAVLARWKAPSELPIVEVGIDWRAHRASGIAKAPFDGEYAQGSLVDLLETEAMGAADRIKEGDVGGWRNTCFDA